LSGDQSRTDDSKSWDADADLGRAGLELSESSQAEAPTPAVEHEEARSEPSPRRGLPLRAIVGLAAVIAFSVVIRLLAALL
jgi:hypothetical protein